MNYTNMQEVVFVNNRYITLQQKRYFKPAPYAYPK